MKDRPTVIVPTLKGARLEELLTSLSHQTVEHEVIIADNGATVDRAQLRSRFPFAEVIPFKRNLGFGAAVNRAAAEASGSVLLITNDDCVLAPNCVEVLTDSVGKQSGVDMAAGVLLSSYDDQLIDSAGIEVDRTLMAFDYLHGCNVRALEGKPQPPLGPCGGAAAYSREAFRDAGGFDEGLFAYLEDVDLALRLRLNGVDCALCTAARAVHEHSSTLGPGSPAKNYLMGFGRGYLLRKWRVLRPSLLATVMAQELLLCGGQALIDRNLAGVRGRVQGYHSSSAGREYPAALLARYATEGPSFRRRLKRRLRSRSTGQTAPSNE